MSIPKYSCTFPLCPLSPPYMLGRYPANLVTSNLSTFDTFKSSMCHTTVIYLYLPSCLPNMGRMGWSGTHMPQYSLPNSCITVVRCAVGHTTPFVFEHIWVLLMMEYFSYILVATFYMRSDSAPFSIMSTSLSIYMWRYASGMSNVATSQPSCAYTVAVMNTDYVETLDEAGSSFFIVSRFFLPSAYVHPFMSKFWFPFRNINGVTASALCFLVSLDVSTGAKFSKAGSCFSSFVVDVSPRSLDLFSPVFSAYWVMMMWSMWFSLYSLVMSVLRWIYPLSIFLSTIVGISLVTCFLSLVGYFPECSDTGSSYYSDMTSLSLLSLLSLSIRIGYCASSSGGSTSSTSLLSSS